MSVPISCVQEAVLLQSEQIFTIVGIFLVFEGVSMNQVITLGDVLTLTVCTTSEIYSFVSCLLHFILHFLRAPL